MTRTCYLCAAEIIDVGERSACPECGLLHPFIPAVEPAVSAPAVSPRRGLPAAGQLATGSGATSSWPLPGGAFYANSARVQVRAEAAPGGRFTPSAAGRGTDTPTRGNIRATIALAVTFGTAPYWPALIAWIGGAL